MASAENELTRTLEELGSLQGNLEHINERLNRFGDRALGALPPTSGAAGMVTAPEYNAGMTGSVRRAIFASCQLAQNISDNVERIMAIG